MILCGVGMVSMVGTPAGMQRAIGLSFPRFALRSRKSVAAQG